MSKITLSLCFANQSPLQLWREPFNYSPHFNNVSMLMMFHILCSLAHPLIMSPPFNNTVISGASARGFPVTRRTPPQAPSQGRVMVCQNRHVRCALQPPWKQAVLTGRSTRQGKNQGKVGIMEDNGAPLQAASSRAHWCGIGLFIRKRVKIRSCLLTSAVTTQSECECQTGNFTQGVSCLSNAGKLQGGEYSDAIWPSDMQFGYSINRS